MGRFWRKQTRNIPAKDPLPPTLPLQESPHSLCLPPSETQLERNTWMRRQTTRYYSWTTVCLFVNHRYWLSLAGTLRKLKTHKGARNGQKSSLNNSDKWPTKREANGVKILSKMLRRLVKCVCYPASPGPTCLIIAICLSGGNSPRALHLHSVSLHKKDTHHWFVTLREVIQAY